jgi:hypothetical protein
MQQAAAALPVPADAPPFDSSLLVDAYDASAAAATSSDISDAMRAQQMLDALAQAASAQASQAGLTMQPGLPSASPQSPSQSQSKAQGGQQGAPGGKNSNPQMGTGAQATDPRVAQLKNLGISINDWARLPGDLQDEVLQAAQSAGPDEYRAIIQRYFQEVAKRGAAETKP